MDSTHDIEVSEPAAIAFLLTQSHEPIRVTRSPQTLTVRFDGTARGALAVWEAACARVAEL